MLRRSHHFLSPLFKQRIGQQVNHEYDFSTILFLSVLESGNWKRQTKALELESGCTGCDKNTSNVLKTGSHKFIILHRFLVNHAVFSRECCQCLSTHSWKDCDDKRYRVRCLDSQHCIRASGHSSSDEAYVKGCYLFSCSLLIQRVLKQHSSTIKVSQIKCVKHFLWVGQ